MTKPTRPVYATDNESSRYALGGVLIELAASSLTAVATDGRRLARQEGPATSVGGHVSGDTMTIWRFNPDWLEKLFDENRIRISHENVGDQIVLTASTEELQKFIAKYSYDQEAYVDPEILIRSGS